MSRLRIVLVTIGAIALLSVAYRLYAQEAIEKPLPKQRIVYLLQSGQSHVMAGDADEALLARKDAVLPFFLTQGWRIARIEMTASAGVNPDQVIGIAILEK